MYNSLHEINNQTNFGFYYLILSWCNYKYSNLMKYRILYNTTMHCSSKAIDVHEVASPPCYLLNASYSYDLCFVKLLESTQNLNI